MPPPHDAHCAPSSLRMRFILIGLLLTTVMASLDQNIIGPALPRIVAELRGPQHISLVITTFMLASTVTMPLYGRFSDQYGRRPLFFAAIAIFVLGSMLCGIAQNFAQLIVFRGIQGLGAGGLASLARTAIADIAPPSKRVRQQGLFAAVYTLANVVGPLTGGFLTDTLSWRWIFYINLPVGAAALACLANLPTKRSTIRHKIDYAGAFLLTTFAICLLLLLRWGGVTYSWHSLLILGLAGTLVAASILFIWYEKRVADPILPPRLFANRVFSVATAISTISAISLFTSIIFFPIYFQLGLGMTATKSGLMTMPLMVGVIAASVIGGRLAAATGRYKAYLLVGLVTASGAFLELGWAATSGGRHLSVEIALILLGAGFGLAMPILAAAIQNSVDQSDLGAATASAMFFRSLGGTVGIAVAGVVMTDRLEHRLAALGISSTNKAGAALSDVDHFVNMSQASRNALAGIYQHTMSLT
jgi:EmrB/QacA subfamily drug resistance transporter